MYWISKRLYAAAAAAVLVSVCGSASASTIVKMQFNIGLVTPPFDTVYIELFDDTPATRDNFLNYVNDGDFTNVLMHRLVRNFVLQGGGFDASTGAPIPTDPPVVNEFARSNLRGTIAMAKLSNAPDSATSQFFFNLVDNSANLDNTNGGFTVFARVLGNGMDLIDAFATLTIKNFGGALSEIPIWVRTDPVTLEEFDTPLFMESVSVAQLRIGDTDLDGAVSQADADLLTSTLVGGTDEPQYDVDANGSVNQADLDLLDALLLGDLDGDGFVGITDLNIVLGSWNQSVPPGDPQADASGDGFVGIEDLNLVLGAWNVGSPPPPAALVPEPASLALLGFGTALMLTRRRR